jgi:hypothetical protein
MEWTPFSAMKMIFDNALLQEDRELIYVSKLEL